ncbi:MAG: hypothetical protein HYW90_04520 [Candidatus Sungbacteria bacterium]|nr:hypothetical protein [Candidatus Sungbacteria bacterium]
MAKKGMTAVLKDMFGYHPADPAKSGMTVAEVKAMSYADGVRVGGLKGFSVELGRLSDEEKLELARAAAKELGLTQDQVDFPLS